MPANQSGPERRSLTRAPELRAGKDGSVGMLDGYAAVFRSDSCLIPVDPEDPGMRVLTERGFRAFRETIEPGAFADCLGRDCLALRNHDPNQLLGRESSGTLRIFQDDVGLRYENDLPDTSDGRDVAYLAKRGDIQGNSFSFDVAEGGDRWDLSADVPIRTVHRFARIYDVGPVTNPAYRATSLSVRSFPEAAERLDAERRELEEKSKAEAREDLSKFKARLSV